MSEVGEKEKDSLKLNGKCLLEKTNEKCPTCEEVIDDEENEVMICDIPYCDQKICWSCTQESRSGPGWYICNKCFEDESGP